MRLMVYTRQITNDEYTFFSFISNERLTMYWEYSRLYQSIRPKICLLFISILHIKFIKETNILYLLYQHFDFTYEHAEMLITLGHSLRTVRTKMFLYVTLKSSLITTPPLIIDCHTYNQLKVSFKVGNWPTY